MMQNFNVLNNNSRYAMYRTKVKRGFTLAEVLVALVILSSCFLALVQTSSRYTKNTIYLRDKTFAHWVAMNRMAELRLEKKFPELGNRVEGTSDMAGREWYWRQKVSDGKSDNFRRVNISVKYSADRDNEKAKNLAFIETYVLKPVKP